MALRVFAKPESTATPAKVGVNEFEPGVFPSCEEGAPYK
jgi:hypothetical protein